MENKNKKITKSGMIKVKKCPCCENRNLSVLYKNMWDKMHFVNGIFDLLVCNKCRLIFLEPRLNEKQLSKYYPEKEYYSFHNINPLALKYHKLCAYYYSKKNPLVSLLLTPFKPLFYTYFTDNNHEKALLEIGCGDGLKLAIYQQYGLKTAGLEPYGSKLTEKEKGLGIKRQSLKEARYKENSFDIIVLKEVLEHIPNQKLVLEKCRKWLKPEGKLIITIPNTDGLWVKMFGENWFGYDVPRHLYNYNQKNIRIVLNKYGLKINKIRAYDTPYMLDGSFSFRAVALTRKREHPIIFSNAAKILFTPISLLVSYLGKGSLMEIECGK